MYAVEDWKVTLESLADNRSMKLAAASIGCAESTLFVTIDRSRKISQEGAQWDLLYFEWRGCVDWYHNHVRRAKLLTTESVESSRKRHAYATGRRSRQAHIDGFKVAAFEHALVNGDSLLPPEAARLASGGRRQQVINAWWCLAILREPALLSLAEPDDADICEHIQTTLKSGDREGAARLALHFIDHGGSEREAAERANLRQAADHCAAAKAAGASQARIANGVGRSPAWVSVLLRWRQGGFQGAPFGPRSHTARQAILARANARAVTRNESQMASVSAEPLRQAMLDSEMTRHCERMREDTIGTPRHSERANSGGQRSQEDVLSFLWRDRPAHPHRSAVT